MLRHVLWRGRAARRGASEGRRPGRTTLCDSPQVRPESRGARGNTVEGRVPGAGGGESVFIGDGVPVSEDGKVLETVVAMAGPRCGCAQCC